MKEIDRDYYVFRLLQADKELVKSLGCDRGTRHEALLDLVPIVESLEVEKYESPQRYPVRVGIPATLKKALQKVAKRSGQPMTEIFLRAARAYREANPLDD